LPYYSCLQCSPPKLPSSRLIFWRSILELSIAFASPKLEEALGKGPLSKIFRRCSGTLPIAFANPKLEKTLGKGPINRDVQEMSRNSTALKSLAVLSVQELSFWKNWAILSDMGTLLDLSSLMSPCL
jgi:hypothetical protein